MSVATTPRGYIDRPRPSGLADVIEVILDKGIVIDAFVRVSLIGIEILTIDARIVIASVDTYLRFAEAVNRLDLMATETSGLPEMMDEIGEGGASSKTKGVEHGGMLTFHELAPSLTHVELSIDIEPESLVQRLGRSIHLPERAIRAELHLFKAWAELWQEVEDIEPPEEPEEPEDEADLEEEPDHEEELEDEEEPEDEYDDEPEDEYEEPEDEYDDELEDEDEEFEEEPEGEFVDEEDEDFDEEGLDEEGEPAGTR